MTSITYVGGMTDVTRRRCEKSIRAFLLQWLQCANTSGSFCFTYIKGLSFSFPQVQQHGSSGEVWVQVPERAKRGKFTFGTGVKGAMCRVWSEDQSVSHGDLVCALEEVIPQVQEYYTKKKKNVNIRLGILVETPIIKNVVRIKSGVSPMRWTSLKTQRKVTLLSGKKRNLKTNLK